MNEIDQIWRAYLQGTLALMLIMAILFIIIGFAIGLPGALAIGLLTGFLSMIPELGPWIAGIIATLVAFILGSNYLPISRFWFAVLVAGIFAVVTQIKSVWLRPQVYGRFMRMNTGIVFLAIIGATMLQGILAALIILPILATIGVLGRYTRAKILDLDPWPEIIETDSRDPVPVEKENGDDESSLPLVEELDTSKISGPREKNLLQSNDIAADDSSQHRSN
jgi:predicted PurR-regulated permease PerM